jgi:hypothetical protein
LLSGGVDGGAEPPEPVLREFVDASGAWARDVRATVRPTGVVAFGNAKDDRACLRVK